MKRLFCLIALAVFIIPSPIMAVESTPSATPVPTKNKQVEDLKERLATKVAQLRQSERRAIYGTVKATTISTATIETLSKDIKIELTDDIKVFQMLKGKRTSLTIENIEKNDVVTVFGEWDTAVEMLRAKVVFIEPPAADIRKIFGKITESDKSNYTVTIETADKKTFIVDFETSTKTSTWSKDTGIEKGSFSKLLTGDTVLVVGTPVQKKDDRLSALRILDIGTPTGTKATNTPKTEAIKEASSSPVKTAATPTKKTTPIP